MPNTYGFIKLSRSISACNWFEDNNTLAVLVRLTLSAEWQDTSCNGIELKRGQLITTIPQIAQSNQLTVQQTRTILNRLKSTGRITVRSTPKFSIITLNDFDSDFKSNRQINRQPPGNQQTKQQSINRPSLLYKENKNIQEAEETARTRASGAVSNVLVTAVREYNENCKSLEPLTGELSYHQGRLVVEAFKELHGVSFAEYFRRVEASDYLTGRTSRGYKTDFNWLIRPENVAKVLSGKYDKNFESGAVTASPAKKDYDEPLWDD